MSDPRITLRHVRIALHVAIAWQLVLLTLESQREWRFVEYAVWILPIAGLFAAIEFLLWGIGDRLHADLRAFELHGLRFRSSLVTYLAAFVIFTRETIAASIVYAVLHRLATGSRVAWMPVDVAMIIASLVYLALGNLDPFQFAAVLTVMVSVVTVAIYQDDTSRVPEEST